MAIDFLIGRKVGMTRIFDELGSDFPVTIIEAGPCSVTQIKSVEKDGISSVQIGFVDKSKRHTKKSEKGHFEKVGVPIKKFVKEFASDKLEDVEPGQEINADIFETGDFVSVTGVSKGKGFAGHMKRHGFSGGRRSHGKNSVMRKAGSVGAGSDPSRVWPGSRMAGRMGNAQVSVKNLEVARVEKDNNLIFIKGAVPGARNGIVYLSKQ
jgi:large subunit ribosomal protein L3